MPEPRMNPPNQAVQAKQAVTRLVTGSFPAHAEIFRGTNRTRSRRSSPRAGPSPSGGAPRGLPLFFFFIWIWVGGVLIAVAVAVALPSDASELDSSNIAIGPFPLFFPLSRPLLLRRRRRRRALGPGNGKSGTLARGLGRDLPLWARSGGSRTLTLGGRCGRSCARPLAPRDATRLALAMALASRRRRALLLARGRRLFGVRSASFSAVLAGGERVQLRACAPCAVCRRRSWLEGRDLLWCHFLPGLFTRFFVAGGELP
jgi:hypothetical protein